MGKLDFFNIFKRIKRRKALLEKGLDVNVVMGFLDKIEDIVCIADDNYKIDYINSPELAQKYKFLLEFLNYDENKELFNEMISTTRREGFFIKEIELYRDNKSRNMYIAIYYIESVQKFVIYIKDTDKYKETEILLKEELSKSNEELKNKELFVANLSHEIRTPINIIISIIYFLKSTKLDETQNKYIKKLEEATNILTDLVNNILSVTQNRKVSNVMNTKEKFVLGDFLDKISQMFIEKLKDKNIQWSIESNFDTNIEIYEDKTKLEQVFINLISNSVKYTNKGYIELSVNKIKEEIDYYTIRFCLKDTGIGIKKEDSIKIFQEFEQTKDPTIKEREGFGLGLPLVKKIIEGMGGKIWLESSYGLGSKFYFELQLMKEIQYNVLEDKITENKKINLDDFEPISNNKILLVDDNQTINELTKKILEEIEIECDIVTSGTEAIKKVEENGTSYYKLILMDIHMPKYNGYDISRILKQKIGVKTPIIALTATNITESIIEQNKDYIYSYIQKPIKPEELKSMVKRILNQMNMENDAINEKQLVLYISKKIENNNIKKNLDMAFNVIFTDNPKDINIIIESKKVSAIIIDKNTINKEEILNKYNDCLVFEIDYNNDNQNKDIRIISQDGYYITVDNERELSLLLLNMINKKNKESNMNNILRKYNDDISNVYSFLYDSLVNLTAIRSKETGAHLMRTKEYMKVMLREYKKNFSDFEIDSEKTIEDIGTAATLHDIGKVGIPDEILNKPGRLTEEEMRQMKEHTTIGYQILKNSDSDKLSNEVLEYAKEITLHHHEKWNGTGYPDGLKGEEINIISRIMALIDVYDALINDRVYKKAMSYEETTEYIISQSGILFDPKVVNVFVSIKDKLEEINEKYKENN